MLLPTLSSHHFILELSRDSLIWAGCLKCVGVLATAEPRGGFAALFDVPWCSFSTDIHSLSSTGVGCASSGPCPTATWFTPYEVASSPKIQHWILSMCSCTAHFSLYMRVKLSTHNLFSNLDTAGETKFRFKGRLKLGMYLHLQHNTQIIYMRREPVWKMISEITLLRWQIQWQTQEASSDINFWSINGCNS